MSVQSDMLKKWRCVKYENVDDIVVVTTLARLTKRKNSWPKYNVSTFTERERVITEITKQIIDFAEPFFSRFDDLDLLIEDVEKQEFSPIKDSFIRKNAANDFVQCFKI